MTSADYRKQGRRKNHASWAKHMRPAARRAAHKVCRRAAKQELAR